MGPRTAGEIRRARMPSASASIAAPAFCEGEHPGVGADADRAGAAAGEHAQQPPGAAADAGGPPPGEGTERT